MDKRVLLGSLAAVVLLFPGLSLAGAPAAAAHHHDASRVFVTHRYHRRHCKKAQETRPWSGKSTGASGSKSSTSSGSSTTTSSGSTTSTSGSSTTSSTGKTIDGYQVVKTISLTATAYGPSAQDNYPYGAVDYFGNPLVAGDVAVDPSVIPLGTKLWVTGYNSPNLPAGGFLATADDEGGAIKGNRLDIYINEPDSIVSNFGIQGVTVYVLGN